MTRVSDFKSKNSGVESSNWYLELLNSDTFRKALAATSDSSTNLVPNTV